MIIDYSKRKQEAGTETNPVSEQIKKALDHCSSESGIKSRFLRQVGANYAHAFEGSTLTGLNEKLMRGALSLIQEKSLSDLERSTRPHSLFTARDEKGLDYRWEYCVEYERSEGFYFTDRLSRSDPSRPLFEEHWNEKERRWENAEPFDTFDFDQKLMSVLSEAEHIRALFLAAAMDRKKGHLSVSSWNLILLEHTLLLHLAARLPAGTVEFCSTEIGFCLLPSKHHLVGLGICQQGRSLYLAAFLPDRARQMMQDIFPNEEKSLAKTVCRIGREQALSLLLAEKALVSDRPDGLCLYLPLSKKTILLEKELPSQSTCEDFREKVLDEHDLTKKESDLLECLMEFLDSIYSEDDDDVPDLDFDELFSKLLENLSDDDLRF